MRKADVVRIMVYMVMISTQLVTYDGGESMGHKSLEGEIGVCFLRGIAKIASNFLRQAFASASSQ